jgi:hypothetical protein
LKANLTATKEAAQLHYNKRREDVQLTARNKRLEEEEAKEEKEAKEESEREDEARAAAVVEEVEVEVEVEVEEDNRVEEIEGIEGVERVDREVLSRFPFRGLDSKLSSIPPEAFEVVEKEP